MYSVPWTVDYATTIPLEILVIVCHSGCIVLMLMLVLVQVDATLGAPCTRQRHEYYDYDGIQPACRRLVSTKRRMNKRTMLKPLRHHRIKYQEHCPSTLESWVFLFLPPILFFDPHLRKFTIGIFRRKLRRKCMGQNFIGLINFFEEFCQNNFVIVAKLFS